MIVNNLVGINLLSSILIFFVSARLQAQHNLVYMLSCDNEQIPLKHGDFIFQDLDCELCEAIELITASEKLQKSFSHVGLVVNFNNELVVIEAIGTSVKITQPDSFIFRSTLNQKPKVAIGRLKTIYQSIAYRAANETLSHIGKPYDDYFLINNNAFYCSELIYESFKKVNDNADFFNLYPMNYNLPDGQIQKVWLKYFTALKTDVPQGLPGCNPNSIASDEKFEWIRYCY